MADKKGDSGAADGSPIFSSAAIKHFVLLTTICSNDLTEKLLALRAELRSIDKNMAAHPNSTNQRARWAAKHSELLRRYSALISPFSVALQQQINVAFRGLDS